MQIRDPRFVYFIRPVGWDSPIKVGCSIFPVTRLSALMAWSPFPLEILATAPGGMADEKRIHQRFGADRLRGEWFRTTRELIDLIDAVAKTGALPFEVIGDRRDKLPGLPAFLKRHGLSRKRFAERAGTSAAWITQLSNQETRGSAGRVIATLNELGIECSIDELAEVPASKSGAAA